MPGDKLLVDTRMRPGDQLDGYTILRRISRGGYGEVWLCRVEATGEFRAMKFIAAERPDLLEKEFRALANYRKATSRLCSPYLIPIEHIGNNAQGLYYVMPVADGTGNDPADPDWHPLTLALLIEQRSRAETWFSCEEIAGWMCPVLEALQTLTDAGFVHRDVKPDNILIIGVHPTLGDIGLMDEDHATLSRRGTPGYLTPSWYKSGHPDMYGAAATLYTLLTGNLPDRMGRSAFNAPPQGDASLNAPERSRRTQFHAVIRRAAEERSAERYRDFRAMRDALSEKPKPRPLRRILSGALVAVLLFVASGAATLGLPKLNGRSWAPKSSFPLTMPQAVWHAWHLSCAATLRKTGSRRLADSAAACNLSISFRRKRSANSNHKSACWDGVLRLQPSQAKTTARLASGSSPKT